MYIEMHDFNQKQADIREEKRKRDAEYNLTEEERSAKICEILGMTMNP